MLDEEDLINSSDDCRWMGTERKDPDYQEDTQQQQGNIISKAQNC